MGTAKKVEFPLRETWTIEVDTWGKHRDVCCFLGSSGKVLKWGLMVQATSLDDLPHLIEEGKKLLKRKKAEEYPEREAIHYYG